MAGAERSGLAAARADLFEGCVCLLTPVEGRTAPDALAAVADFWERLGARTHRMTPPTHDEAVAAVSHLPHLLAAVLAGSARRRRPRLRRARLAGHDAPRRRFARIVDRNLEPQPRAGYKCGPKDP